MELMVCLVDWPEAQRREAEGRLTLTLGEALDAGEAWLEPFSLVDESHHTSLAVGEAYEMLRDRIPMSERGIVDAFLSAIAWEGGAGHPNDLGQAPDPDACMSSLAPDRVRELARGAPRAIEQVRVAARGCPEETWEDCPFDEDFLPFLAQFVPLFEKAAGQGRGVLVQAG